MENRLWPVSHLSQVLYFDRPNGRTEWALRSLCGIRIPCANIRLLADIWVRSVWTLVAGRLSPLFEFLLRASVSLIAPDGFRVFSGRTLEGVRRAPHGRRFFFES